MNPFTESTVALPLGDDPASDRVGVASIVTAKKRRFRFGLMGSLAPIVGAGMMAAISLPGLAHAVDVNSATQAQLQGVRGLGPKTAQFIIEERSRGGRYSSFEDLSDRVKGVGPKKAAALQASGLTIGSADGIKTAAPQLRVAPAPVATAAKSPGPPPASGPARNFNLRP